MARLLVSVGFEKPNFFPVAARGLVSGFRFALADNSEGPEAYLGHLWLGFGFQFAVADKTSQRAGEKNCEFLTRHPIVGWATSWLSGRFGVL